MGERENADHGCDLESSRERHESPLEGIGNGGWELGNGQKDDGREELSRYECLRSEGGLNG